MTNPGTVSRHAQKWVKNLLMDWAEKMHKIEEGSSIGYPSMTIEGKFMSSSLVSSSIPRSICPEVVMSRRISACDQAVKSLNARLREIIRYKYEEYGNEMEKMRRYQAFTGRSQKTWHRDIEKAHEAVIMFVINHE